MPHCHQFLCVLSGLLLDSSNANDMRHTNCNCGDTSVLALAAQVEHSYCIEIETRFNDSILPLQTMTPSPLIIPLSPKVVQVSIRSIIRTFPSSLRMTFEVNTSTMSRNVGHVEHSSSPKIGCSKHDQRLRRISRSNDIPYTKAIATFCKRKSRITRSGPRNQR